MNRLVSFILLAFSLISYCQSQHVVTIDVSTNTVKRSWIATDKSNLKKEFLMDNYLNQVNGNFKIKEESYKRVFNKMLNVGNYLVFEIVNFDKENSADSVLVTYKFFDDNTEYASVFEGIVNAGLNNLPNSSPSNNKENPRTDNKNTSENTLSTNSSNLGSELSKNKDSISRQIADLSNKYMTEFKINPLNFALTIENQLNIGVVDPLKEVLSIYDVKNGISYDSMTNILRDSLTNMIEDSIKPSSSSVIDSINKNLPIIFPKWKDSEFKIDTVKGEVEVKNNVFGLIGKSKHFKFIPLQIQNKDFTYFNVTGLSKGRPVYYREYIFHNRWGFKADFSAGFVATKLMDHRYIMKSVQDSTGASFNQILRQDDGKFQIGVAIHGHFYTRFARRFNLALSPGFSFNTDSRVNYLLGGSILMGKEQRFIINGGIAFGKVLRISDIYEVGDLIDTNITEVPTKEKWNRGWYLGVSYNF